MKIAVVTIVYSSTACPASVLETASSSGTHTVECHLFLHSRYSQLRQSCDRLAQDRSVVYYPYATNRGVSKSWNEGMLAAYGAHADVVIIANDDVAFAPGDLSKIAEKASECRPCYIISCAGFHQRFNHRQPSVGYACFAINSVAIEKLGCFDENIFPAYCEDQDYARRARLSGLYEENCPDTNLTHAGSNSVLSDAFLAQQNAMTHKLNRAYYRRKWGGDGDHETYNYPFNDPRLNCYISPRNRQSPYGPIYDRRDHGIVKV